MPLRFRWVEASQWRHATAEQWCEVGDRIATLCGVTAVVAHRDTSRTAPYPECPGCDRVWREAAGIKQRADVLAGR